MADDYEESYDTFWKDIVENQDGTLNLDQVKRELHDYNLFMANASTVYEHVTGGMISKPNTSPAAVIAEADRVAQEWVDDYLTNG